MSFRRLRFTLALGFACGSAIAAPPKNFDSVFADDNVADIRVTIGYWDDNGKRPADTAHVSPYLRDKLFKMGFRSKSGLAEEYGVKPARFPWESLFHVFEKDIGGGRKVRVALISSSLGLNADPESAKQQAASDNARAFLIKGAQEAEIWMYTGHSREGGGPDTYPPVLLDNGYLNYAYYRKQKPGLKEIMDTFAEREEKPVLVGSMSCSSHRHFYGFLSRALADREPDTVLVLSGNTMQGYVPPNSVLAVIRTVVEGKSVGDLDKSLKACQEGAVKPGFAPYMEIFYPR